MASVTSLDGDLRRMRLDKYTPSAVREARTWIEDILGEPLAPGDLLEALKDGVALCRLANMAIPPPGIRFKKSAMPFVQMENISHFLRACQAPPLNLQQHDTFLTVDLYEAKDPAQVLQCLGAFSRAANKAKPSAFPTAIGARPTTANATATATPASPPGRGPTPGSGRPKPSVYSSRTPVAPARSGDGSTSSWSKRELEGATSPAWNIAQYGYMGGASQGNLGISFGGRRQITAAGPSVPSALQKERLRKEKEADELRAKQLMEEEEARRRAALEADEERARREEARLWEEETERQRVAEKSKADEERRKWEEEERQWRLTEEARKREEEEAEARLVEERQRRLRSANNSNSNTSAAAAGSSSDPKLNGQFLSQYKAEAATAAAVVDPTSSSSSAYTSRVRELEKELAEAREREQAYEKERQGRPGIVSSLAVNDPRTRSRSRGARSRSRPRAVPNLASPPVRQESWSRNDKEILVTPRSRSRHRFADMEPQPVVEDADHFQSSSQQPLSPRPLPDPRNHFQQPLQSPQSPPQPKPKQSPQSPRSPPQSMQSPRSPQVPPRQQQQQQQAQSPPPQSTGPTSIFQKLRAHLTGEKSAPPTNDNVPSAISPVRAQRTGDPNSTSPASRSQGRPLPNPTSYASPPKQEQQRQPPVSTTSGAPRAGPGKSLLEREMEMERQRQREWEEAQQETAAAPRQADNVEGVNGRWDVNQWNGYTGGDSQNRGSQGIGSGRRQIVGPRPLPGQR